MFDLFRPEGVIHLAARAEIVILLAAVLLEHMAEIPEQGNIVEIAPAARADRGLGKVAQWQILERAVEIMVLAVARLATAQAVTVVQVYTNPAPMFMVVAGVWASLVKVLLVHLEDLVLSVNLQVVVVAVVLLASVD
jgi:hypothetical protein